MNAHRLLAIVLAGLLHSAASYAEPKAGVTFVGDKLYAGGKLLREHALLSPNAKYTLVMQDDGNLVLYRIGSTKALWSSKTDGKAVAWAAMQADGNFVIYSQSGRPIWASNTDRKPIAYLAMQDDGNAVIYQPSGKVSWATNTNQSRSFVDDRPVAPTEEFCCTVHDQDTPLIDWATLQATGYRDAVLQCRQLMSKRFGTGMQVSKGLCPY